MMKSEEVMNLITQYDLKTIFFMLHVYVLGLIVFFVMWETPYSIPMFIYFSVGIIINISYLYSCLKFFEFCLVDNKKVNNIKIYSDVNHTVSLCWFITGSPLGLYYLIGANYGS